MWKSTIDSSAERRKRQRKNGHGPEVLGCDGSNVDLAQSQLRKSEGRAGMVDSRSDGMSGMSAPEPVRGIESKSAERYRQVRKYHSMKMEREKVTST